MPTTTSRIKKNLVEKLPVISKLKLCMQDRQTAGWLKTQCYTDL